MWQLKRLYIKNWQSFVEQEYEFVNGRPLLIQGINLSDESAESNGSGKSSFQEAIHYLLTGNSIRKTRDSRLIRNGEDSSLITLELFNSLLGQKLFISRELFIKNTSKLLVEFNDIKQEFVSINEGNKLIIQIIGISIEDIQNYFIINKERYISFFSTSDTKKKELIGRFSNADKVLQVESIINEDISVLNKELQSLNNEKISLTTRIQMYNEELSNLSSEKLSEQRDKEINIILEKIESCINNISKYEFDIQEYNKQISLKIKEKESFIIQKDENSKILNSLEGVNFEKEIIGIESDKLISIKERDLVIKQKLEIESNIDETRQFIREINNNLAGAIKCPKCLHEFVLENKDISIEEIREVLPDITDSLSKLNVKLSVISLEVIENNNVIKTYDDKIKSFQLQIDEFNKKKRDIQKTINAIEQAINLIDLEIVKFNSKINTTISLITDENNRIVNFELDIENTVKKDIGDKVSNLNEKIKENELSISKNESLISNKETEIFKLKQWVFNFKKFYSYLSNKSLSVIEGYANMYLEKMKSPYQIRLEGVKVLADGKLKENITPIILKNGYEEYDYSQLSGGQKGRIDFSLILTNQMLINLSSPNGGLGFLHVDEVTESIDSRGHLCLLEALKPLNKTIFITTHVNINSNEDIMTVKYENGVSKIISNG